MTEGGVSAATWGIVQDLFDAEPCGPIHLRGHGPMETYAIIGRRRGDTAKGTVPQEGTGHEQGTSAHLRLT
jgi:hypothetical protein